MLDIEVPVESGWRSVTTIVRAVINPGEPLLRWANKQGLQGIALGETRARTQGADAGHAVHKVLEHLAAGSRPPLTEFDQLHRGYVSGVYSWLDRHERRITDSEITLSSQRLKVTGRTDYLRTCRRPDCACGGYGRVLGDMKLGRLTAYAEAHLQCSGYVLMWREEEREETICGTEVLTVSSQGRYRAFPGLAVPEDFELAALWHARFRQLEQRVQEQRDL